MKTRTVLIAFAALTSAIAHADKAKHEQQYCAALGDFHSDLKALENMKSDSTLKDLRETSDRVADDANRVQKEGGKIKTPTSKQFKDSVSQLDKEVKSLPESLTIAQAQSRIEGDLKNVRMNAKQLATESGCPEAVPAESPKSSTG